MTPREELLQEAIKITTHDRNSAYGDPEDNFKDIANYWTLYLGQTGVLNPASFISTQDVAHLMVLMKMARLAKNPVHRDSLVDIAGYAACAADCLVNRAVGKTEAVKVDPVKEITGAAGIFRSGSK